MEEQQYENEEQQFLNPPPQRPTGLSIVCILSFIGSAWSVLQNLATFAVYNSFKKALEDDDLVEKLENVFGNQFDTVMNSYKMIFSIDRIYYIVAALFFAVSFIGVLYMWKMQKKGFHIYAIAQILILTIGVLFYYSVVGLKPWADVIWSVFFVLLYFPYYKKLMQ